MFSINALLPIDPIKHDSAGVFDPAEISTEVDMKVNQVSVLVSKKIGKHYCSWSLSYGATAQVEEEHFTEAISQLDSQLNSFGPSRTPITKFPDFHPICRQISS